MHQPFPGLTSYTTPRDVIFSKVTKTVDASKLGVNFNGVSRHGLSLWVDQRFAQRWTAGIGVRHVGANQGIGDTARATVPAYALWDALLGYDMGSWDVRVNVRNLANKNYFASCGDGSCYYGDTRRVTLSGTYRW